MKDLICVKKICNSVSETFYICATIQTWFCLSRLLHRPALIDGLSLNGTSLHQVFYILSTIYNLMKGKVYLTFCFGIKIYSVFRIINKRWLWQTRIVLKLNQTKCKTDRDVINFKYQTNCGMNPITKHCSNWIGEQVRKL